MMKNFVFALILAGFFVDKCLSSPLGAPEKACASMRPGHYPGPQEDPSPYFIVFAPAKSKDRSFYVSILSQELEPFKGFFIQARANKSGEAIGEWETHTKRTRLANCFNRTNNGVTHNYGTFDRDFRANLNFHNITFEWKAPKDKKLDKIYFIATVVKTFSEYYMGITKTLRLSKYKY